MEAGRWTCDRCGAHTNVTSMSYFNKDIICPVCRRDERLAPGYPDAVAAEARAVLDSDYNFAGVGLTPEDEAVLRGLRATRSGHADGSSRS